MNQHELESCFTHLCFGSVTPTPQKREAAVWDPNIDREKSVVEPQIP